MELLKISLLFFIFIFLNGCVQSSALLAPGVTIATTGNVLQAGFQYGANTAIKKETGKDALVYVKDAVKKDHKRRKFNKKFKNMVNNRIINARKKMLVN
ncbi:hypothetical protein N9S64_00020 [Candidatus Pelagibacter sp.]|nr:hypothetical protein [Candidatus Pelagibacter sp.]MDA9631049.1 hypothetical protein [Candidatus Pelagibacter sp.]|tara:strand:- start:840 stop:1136 length:297 start_codon:yes stop_codon:yes gene_type:complete